MVRSNPFRLSAPTTACAVLLTLVAAGPLCDAARAEKGPAGRWSIEYSPALMSVHGHDQHVLTVLSGTGAPAVPGVDGRAVSLDTQSNFSPRLRFDRRGERWNLGVDFLWFDAAQSAVVSGAGDTTAFELPGAVLLAGGRGADLFFTTLEDTTINMWTLDVYLSRRVAGNDEAELRFLVGLRTADFDNDYRAAGRLGDTGGVRLDSSSNYDRFHGPLVALAGTIRRGRHTFETYLGQSVILSTAELSALQRTFVGPFSETPDPDFVDRRSFHRLEDVAVPVTEIRGNWTFDATRRFYVGFGVEAMAWWDLPVPPGVVPGAAGVSRLNENTLTFLAAQATLGVRL